MVAQMTPCQSRSNKRVVTDVILAVRLSSDIKVIHGSDALALCQSQYDLLSVRSCIVTLAMEVPQGNPRDIRRNMRQPALTLEQSVYFRFGAFVWHIWLSAVHGAHAIEMADTPKGSEGRSRDYCNSLIATAFCMVSMDMYYLSYNADRIILCALSPCGENMNI